MIHRHLQYTLNSALLQRGPRRDMDTRALDLLKHTTLQVFNFYKLLKWDLRHKTYTHRNNKNVINVRRSERVVHRRVGGGRVQPERKHVRTLQFGRLHLAARQSFCFARPILSGIGGVPLLSDGLVQAPSSKVRKFSLSSSVPCVLISLMIASGPAAVTVINHCSCSNVQIV